MGFYPPERILEARSNPMESYKRTQSKEMKNNPLPSKNAKHNFEPQHILTCKLSVPETLWGIEFWICKFFTYLLFVINVTIQCTIKWSQGSIFFEKENKMNICKSNVLLFNLNLGYCPQWYVSKHFVFNNYPFGETNYHFFSVLFCFLFLFFCFKK